MTPHEAVLDIWSSRERARDRQLASGRSDAGLRSEVTSGGHMDEMAKLIANVFVGAGIEKENVFFQRSKLELPGYFRAEKKWDVVVVKNRKLIAAVELKAIASSYGNNLNNRTEEAIGNAVDIAHAVRTGLVGTNVPWLGYVFVIRDEHKSRQPVGVKEPHFNVDPAIRGKSYIQRAQFLCSRLMLERIYDRAWFVTADPVEGSVLEPDPEMTWAKFKAAIKGAVEQALA